MSCDRCNLTVCLLHMPLANCCNCLAAFSVAVYYSYGRADSPGVARTRSDALAAEAAKQRPSRLGKNKN